MVRKSDRAKHKILRIQPHEKKRINTCLRAVRDDNIEDKKEREMFVAECIIYGLTNCLNTEGEARYDSGVYRRGKEVPESRCTAVNKALSVLTDPESYEYFEKTRRIA